METEILDVAINLQKKYTKVNEIYNITKQIEESLYRNDYISLKIIIDMRTDVMLEVDDIDYEREILINNFTDDKKEFLRSLMQKGLNQDNIKDSSYFKINELYMKINRELEKIISLDKILNLKIASENTYYKD